MRATNHLTSKKFTFALIGTGCVFAVFGISMLTMVIVPALAPSIVNLANIAIVFLGSVTGVMVGGQSFVDWRHGSQSQFVSEDENRRDTLNETRNENLTGKIEYIARTPRPRDFQDEEID